MNATSLRGGDQPSSSSHYSSYSSYSSSLAPPPPPPAHCAPQLFSTAELFSPGEYEAGSETAHRVLGLFLLAVLGCWSALVLEVHPAWTVRAAYLASGAMEALAGGYL